MVDKTVVKEGSVSAVIIKDNKILVVKRASSETKMPNMWEFPSGKIEWGESPKEATIREAKEESDLDIEILRILYATTYIFKIRGMTIQGVEIFYLCSLLLSSNVKLNPKEHSEFKWITKREISTYPFTHKKEVLDDVLNEV